MKPIFKYISNAKYSTKYLKCEYADNNFLLLDVYLNEKGPPAKIKLLTILSIITMYQNQILHRSCIGYD